MKRREAIAGVASLGVLGAGGVVITRGLPAVDSESPAADGSDDNAGWSDGPIELETIDVQGSEDGTLPVPNDGVTLLNFFAPSCGSCRRAMPHFAAAVDRLRADYADVLTVASVTPPRPEDELADWWDDHDGDWYLGYDPKSRLSTRYFVTGYPVFIAVDPDDEVRWEDDGVIDADRTVRRLEPILEEFVTDAADDSTESADDAADE
ncbi:TlpA family protein disulfide reductase [Natrarchaeobaculum aegyptiacum]|uniref:Thioredoxin domain-containing protein n=1 Tax=Natrarchaeobaculum aegyptiacum TaxID=745377 RepID=A0A2Z2HX98_9EURY|nr:TlpA disulfide reductase family protein [Natrarchaeobaculum aegyptiacum]ARS91503.1 hypothetical protein B1756_18425 [Natrarchaeobaculum aegyptiacum]